MASVSISCPSCSATDGVVRNGKSTAGHQRYLCSQESIKNIGAA
ncbi:Mobile element protein (plasmid) [Escherichia coli]|nr:Mobile element protein [Escherichia coli]